MVTTSAVARYSEHITLTHVKNTLPSHEHETKPNLKAAGQADLEGKHERSCLPTDITRRSCEVQQNPFGTPPRLQRASTFDMACMKVAVDSHEKAGTGAGQQTRDKNR